MLAEFKEKTYEKYFGYELARLTRIAYSPDQCDEALLGFDDAFYLPFPRLFSYHLVSKRRRPRVQVGMAIADIDADLAKIASHFPPFRFNLFIQYKRPEYLRQPQASEWRSWRKPYYRFGLTPHQQKLLERIAARAAKRAAVVYASPAFWTGKELFDFASAERVVQQSNIAHAKALSGHERYTYVEPGSKGIARSDPEELSGPTFSEVLRAGLASDGLPFARHVKDAANLVIAAAREDAHAYQRLIQARAALGLAEVNQDFLMNAMVTLEALSDAFDISYIAIG